MRSAVEKGICLGILPFFAKPASSKNNRVMQLLKNYSLPKTELFAVYPIAKDKSVKLKIFLEACEKYFKQFSEQ